MHHNLMISKNGENLEIYLSSLCLEITFSESEEVGWGWPCKINHIKSKHNFIP